MARLEKDMQVYDGGGCSDGCWWLSDGGDEIKVGYGLTQQWNWNNKVTDFGRRCWC